MRARHAVTRAVEVTVPALTRADTSASVSPASNSGLLVEDPIDVFGLVVCAGVALATRVAAAAAPRTETVNSRRDKGVIGRYDTPGFGIRDLGFASRDSPDSPAIANPKSRVPNPFPECANRCRRCGRRRSTA